MNIYEKLMNARVALKAAGMKQSGNNSYAGYTYFDLADMLPQITAIEAEYKMLSVVRFGEELATLTIYNTEVPDENIEFSSPMSTANLKGCHEVQNLGAVETYIRRYLYLVAYEIVECEVLDKVQGKPDALGEAKTSGNGKPIDSTPSRRATAPHSASNVGHTSYHVLQMTGEEAHSLKVKSGKRLDELTDEQLQRFAEAATSDRYKAAAELLLKERKEEDAYFETLVSEEDLPF